MHPRENYNDLYVFVMVAQEGSFTKAAAKLDIAQSGVSRTVRDLEARLGVQLLNRTTRKLSLTQAGERLYQTAQESFQTLDNGLALLAHYRDTPSGTVRRVAAPSGRTRNFACASGIVSRVEPSA